MNDFKTILAKLKEIIKLQMQTDRKILDKDIAAALNIKPVTFASCKCRNKPPYKAILTYCHDNRIDAQNILFDKDQPVVGYPSQVPIEIKIICIKKYRYRFIQ